MGTYYLPRNVKGEGRILFIFTTKSLIYTVIAGGIGLLFYFLFSLLGMTMVALIGFLIGTVKMPELGKFEFAKKTGGENLDDILKRAIKFKTKGKKIYVYKGGKNDD